MNRIHGVRRRIWFPIAVVAAMAAVFLTFGPMATTSTQDRLQAMAPAAAGSGAFVASPNATSTELEIAKRYEQVRQNPDTIDAYILLGYAYLQHVRETGDPTDYGRAEAALQEVLARQAGNDGAIVGLGVLANARHEFAQALELGNEAVAISPYNSQARGVTVDALTELGRYDDALKAAQDMIDLRPDLASYSRVAYQRELHGDIDGALDAMRTAFDASSGSPAENREYIRVLIGDLYLLKGDPTQATQIYNTSLSVVPGFMWAEAGLGRAALATGDLKTAIVHYQKAVDILPLPELVVALGETQAADGDEADANKTYALVRAEQKLFAANGVNIDLELALFEANHGDPKVAVDDAQRAYATQPNVKVADALGWALYRDGHAAEARQYSDLALRLGSPYATFAYHAGMIALATGDTTTARADLTRALDLRGTMSALDAIDAQAALTQLP
ncbi:MAG: tetratricopeptide repeat protein [Chloroflexota bacterium]